MSRNTSTEERKLAAITFTDMVGYSALAQRDDKLALEPALSKTLRRETKVSSRSFFAERRRRKAYKVTVQPA